MEVSKRVQKLADRALALVEAAYPYNGAYTLPPEVSVDVGDSYRVLRHITEGDTVVCDIAVVGDDEILAHRARILPVHHLAPY